jgi:hypothetical protein
VIARNHPALRAQLAALPVNLVAEVGGLRVAIVHGDCESLAGWSYDESAFHRNAGSARLAAHFAASGARIIASSHTCLPVALRLNRPQGDCVLFNNGAAGMPNFAGTQFGVMTRIATTPAPSAATIYGTVVGGVHVDDLLVNYDHVLGHLVFMAKWPAGSAGNLS